MSKLTRIPKSVQIQHLPYLGDPNFRPQPVLRKYRIFQNVDGVMVSRGPGATTLERACERARELSNRTRSKVAVYDQTRSSGERMIRLFNSGVDYLATLGTSEQVAVR